MNPIQEADDGSSRREADVTPEFILGGTSVATGDPRSRAALQQVLDELRRGLANLVDSVQDPTADLVEPVGQQLKEFVVALAGSRPALADECADLESKIDVFLARLNDELGDIPF